MDEYTLHSVEIGGKETIVRGDPELIYRYSFLGSALDQITKFSILPSLYFSGLNKLSFIFLVDTFDGSDDSYFLHYPNASGIGGQIYGTGYTALSLRQITKESGSIAPAIYASLIAAHEGDHVDWLIKDKFDVGDRARKLHNIVYAFYKNYLQVKEGKKPLVEIIDNSTEEIYENSPFENRARQSAANAYGWLSNLDSFIATCNQKFYFKGRNKLNPIHETISKFFPEFLEPSDSDIEVCSQS